MSNETEERKIEGVDSDTEGVENKVLPPERKVYILRNPPNVNYSDKRGTQRYMEWNNLIFGSNELHSIERAYVNVVNAISFLFKTTPPTNIITNNTILTQYSIKHGIKLF